MFHYWIACKQKDSKIIKCRAYHINTHIVEAQEKKISFLNEQNCLMRELNLN